MQPHSVDSLLNKDSYLARLTDSTKWLQPPCFLLLLCLFALGRIARWDLLDHVAMADRYTAVGYLYPAPTQPYPGGVSVYFPGVSLIACAMSAVLTKTLLVPVLLCVAAAVTFAFIFLQRAIAKDIDNTYEGENFWPIAIIFTLFFAKDWLLYAVEFKPDTIAYLLGAVFLLAHLSRTSPSGTHVSTLAFGLSTGLALVFKQQYVAFMFGCLLFSVYARKAEHVWFSLACLASGALVLFSIRQHSDAWFWTATVLADDGFESAGVWAGLHAVLALKTAMLIFACALARQYGCITSMRQAVTDIRGGLTAKPWIWIVSLCFLSALLSSWKVGGNAGNTAYGLVLTLPFLLLLLKRLNVRLLTWLGWLVLFMQIPPATTSIHSYLLATDLIRAAQSLPVTNSSRVITGSDVYCATRLAFREPAVTNYWTISLRNNSSETGNAELAHLLESRLFDFFIIENVAPNRDLCAHAGHYRIVFENSLGLIGQLTTR